MNPRVKTVKAKTNHTLEIVFTNGEIGIYDCSPLLDFGVFQELKNLKYFKQASMNSGAVTWPHEQDICPDTLYMDSVKVKKKKKIKQTVR
jgi:hypothetical protein